MRSRKPSLRKNLGENKEFCLGSKGEIMKNGIPKIAKFLGKMKIEVKETQFLEIFGRKIFK